MAPHSGLRSSWRLAAYLGWTFLCLPVQIVAVRFPGPFRVWFPRFYHGVCTRLLGLEVTVVGKQASPGPVLYVSNHSSYLDIMVLGAVIPGSFIAKTEVGAWPLFGTLARLQRTVFVSRSRNRSVIRERDGIQSRLEAGDNLILFPEGTTSDGNRVLPFKSAFLAVAESVPGRTVTVQPVSIAAASLDGIPLGRLLRPVYAWYADMTLPGHLPKVPGYGKIRVVVEFHPPVTPDTFGDRKALTEYCWKEVAGGVARAVTGRPDTHAAVVS
ncbi:MAG: 1-acyl-sn-glycerol-3-phosphate acyltransferase [Pseudomonadota bacterium]|nr:1-acyl-sn-glycerol-3-phosphate acyltransferase [Pseudomonadota bacterium]